MEVQNIIATHYSLLHNVIIVWKCGLQFNQSLNKDHIETDEEGHFHIIGNDSHSYNQQNLTSEGGARDANQNPRKPNKEDGQKPPTTNGQTSIGNRKKEMRGNCPDGRVTRKVDADARNFDRTVKCEPLLSTKCLHRSMQRMRTESIKTFTAMHCRTVGQYRLNVLPKERSQQKRCCNAHDGEGSS
jgi:hypothetical protein